MTSVIVLGVTHQDQNGRAVYTRPEMPVADGVPCHPDFRGLGPAGE